MLELSMNEVTTFRWSFEEDIENYCRAGYRSIGVWRHKLSDFDEEHAVDLLVGSGLNVSSLACAGGFTGLGGVSFREGIDDAHFGRCDLAAKLQAGCLVVHPGGRNNHTSRHAFRLLRTALDELLPMAEHYEVPLGARADARGLRGVVDVSDRLRVRVANLVSEYNTPYLKLALDTYHFPWSETDRNILPRNRPAHRRRLPGRSPRAAQHRSRSLPARPRSTAARRHHGDA